jgi:hypothetical protein
VQRCYYQPVTTMQTQTVLQPVTTYRTSFYWEPVTSFRISYYRDPCTGCCKQVACPTTSYRLRSQCCPVTSYVQRCCSVPVTTMRQAFYYEPVTSCCQTSCAPSCPPACPPTSNGAPAVSDRPGQPGVRSYDNGGGSQQYDKPMPPAGQTRRQLSPQWPTAPRIAAPATPEPPKVKLERIVAIPDHNVQGQVVRNDQAQPNAKVLFVNADRKGDQRTLTTDVSGKFQATLASGNWLVYVHGVDGKPVFHSKINVRDDQPSTMTLTSR